MSLIHSRLAMSSSERPLRGLARTAHRILRRARFRLWALRLGARLRRNGSRLILDCPHGGSFERAPVVEVPLEGGGRGSLTLRLGPGASLGRELVLEVWAGADSVLELGESTWLGRGCRVQLQGGSIRIGRATQVHDGCLLKARGEIVVGDGVRVSRGVIFQAEEHIEVGDLAGVGERTSLVDSDHDHDGSETSFWERGVRAEPVRVGRNAWIGANSVLLRGTTIGRNSVVGAGSVVTGGEQPEGWLIAGAPARPVRALGTAGG